MNSQRLPVSVSPASFVAMCAITFILGACSQQAEDVVGSKASSPMASAGASAKASVTDMPVKLCKVVNELAPQASQLSAIGTQAQLVMSIANAFDANAEALRQVVSEIDIVTTASCPASREALLKVLKMNSLQEAVR